DTVSVVVPPHTRGWVWGKNGAERLGLQPHLGPPRPQADAVAEDLRPAQTQLDGGAPGQDTFGYLGPGFGVPAPLLVRAAEQDLVAVREHVHDPRRLGVPVD